MTLYFAQTYDISAAGFYFEDAEQFRKRMKAARNDFGQPVAEFELQFIDGESLDCALASAWGINQANILSFIEAAEEWDDDQKLRFVIAVGECGYNFDAASADPDDYDVDIYEGMSLRELAEDFVEQGLFGEIPEHLQFYIDYEAIARDLAADFTEAEIAGRQLVYACG